MLTLENNFLKLSGVVLTSAIIAVIFLVVYLKVFHKMTLGDLIQEVKNEQFLNAGKIKQED
jgi:uncharacterized membrane protein YjfL (UPF0719 family)